jgi:hypothetical protein
MAGSSDRESTEGGPVGDPHPFRCPVNGFCYIRDPMRSENPTITSGPFRPFAAFGMALWPLNFLTVMVK